ncbi:MAG: DMT family transporter [Rubrivivax sp.]
MTGSHPGLGIALVLLMGLLFAGMDTAIRYLGSTLPVLLLITVRYTFQAVLMAAWLALDRRQRFRPVHLRFQLLRGVLLLLVSAFSFWGLQVVPVAEFTAILLLTPVLVTLLAALVLKEEVSPLRWALVACAFAGAIIVIRPGGGVLGWGVLYPLGGTLTYAFFQLLTRRLAGVESPYTTHFWTGLTGAAILLPLLLLAPLDLGAVWSVASAAQVGLLLLIGALGTSGHLLLILAYGLAPPAVLMPFVYVQIGSAALLGWLAFRQAPDAWGWVGMAVIGASGAASVWLNSRQSPLRFADSAVAD